MQEGVSIQRCNRGVKLSFPGTLLITTTAVAHQLKYLYNEYIGTCSILVVDKVHLSVGDVNNGARSQEATEHRVPEIGNRIVFDNSDEKISREVSLTDNANLS